MKDYRTIYLFSFLCLGLAVPASWADQQAGNTGQNPQDTALAGSIQTSGDYDTASGADPFMELEQMQVRMMEMLKGVMASDFFRSTPGGAAAQTVRPDYDMYETKDAYIINVDAPGMQKEKIDVQVRDGLLNVTAEREKIEEKTQETEASSYHYRGRSFGTFQRNLKIPENVRLDQISAKYENGVLEISLPKSEEQTPEARKIQVA